jgi:hypothetical protein
MNKAPGPPRSPKLLDNLDISYPGALSTPTLTTRHRYSDRT